LDQLGLFELALDPAIEDAFVEIDCPVEIADAQYNVVEPGYAESLLGV
jgi:hypothetical protein